MQAISDFIIQSIATCGVVISIIIDSKLVLEAFQGKSNVVKYDKIIGPASMFLVALIAFKAIVWII
ncbi:MAG: hypothetical protein ACYCO0_00200 [Candidatus Micrarchaeaceae archaeon]